MHDISERGSLAREVRDFSVTDAEIRDDGDDGVTFEGVASVIDTPYMVRDMFGEFSETMARGAFNKTLKEKADVRLLVNHDGVPLARTKSKTLKLTAVPDLRAVASLDPANPTVQEIRSAMSRGDMDQMSIGFRVTKQEWNGDYTERTIKEVELFDVSVVTFPASPTTTASIRSLDEFMQTLTRETADPDEVRRAIAHLESLLVEERTEEDPAVLEARYAALAQLWDQRKAA
jgi:hypothetical protein